MQVCYPTAPAQMFHLLRRQMLRSYRKPLIIMSPKSLLRHKLSVSSLSDVYEGAFEPVIDDAIVAEANNVKRILVCSGKVFYDLHQGKVDNGITDVAIIRLEQLYPFPKEEMKTVLDQYVHAEELVWGQEEPRNQGAWHQIQHYLFQHLGLNQTLGYALRPSSASPAVGYLAKHNFQQKELIEAAFR